MAVISDAGLTRTFLGQKPKKVKTKAKPNKKKKGVKYGKKV